MKSESREVGTNLGLWRYIRPQQFLVAAGGGDDRWYLPAGRGGGDRLFLLRFIHNIFLWPPRRGPNGKGGAVLRGGAAGAPDPLKTLPKTNLALRPFHHPRGALSKNHVFIGSQRLKGGVDATELRHYLGHPDSHHGLAHWFVVHSSGQRLDENGRCDILQLAAGPNPMQEYARHVLGVNTR